MSESVRAGWPQAVSAITLFVEDLAECKRFYSAVFGLPTAYEDDASAVFKFGDLMINLLAVGEAPELIAPAPVGGSEVGRRFQLTVPVDDVDKLYAELTARGATFLNGPMDRPWGIRTAAFADPAGHVWEIAK
ncbi:VOC family protein [Kribbella sancticallisti]|uniref:VOC family protein n=1 Tax=Kribbella sancticallisti TaxID=460087 RepID=A0ABP4PX95_9ACTN